jgi:hypothetical protein
VRRNVTSATDRDVTGRKRFTVLIATVYAEIPNAMLLTRRGLSTSEERREEKINLQDVRSITSAKTVINFWKLKSVREKNIDVMSGCAYAVETMW